MKRTRTFAQILRSWIPSQLRLLCFNCRTDSSFVIKYNIYKSSLSRILSTTSKEVFLYCMEFSEKELEQIVRASCNAERLIFENWDILCSIPLDFGSALKYNTKILSLQWWGDKLSSWRKTDWISDPSCFDNIIDAIANSGLRDSLIKICINFNHSLSIEEVQRKFNEREMSHITVNEEYLIITNS